MIEGGVLLQTVDEQMTMFPKVANTNVCEDEMMFKYTCDVEHSAIVKDRLDSYDIVCSLEIQRCYHAWVVCDGPILALLPSDDDANCMVPSPSIPNDSGMRSVPSRLSAF